MGECPSGGHGLAGWLLAGEDWLMARILHYARRQGYTEYTSTLEEAWRLSISELTRTVASALALGPEVIEFRPDETFESDPISAFAVQEAARHRQRGISLPMFLGLFKYYRQAYVDRIQELEEAPDRRSQQVHLVTRIFDRMEIAFCSAWCELGREARLQELQEMNRRMTNEKNRFLTVTESLGSPVFLLDPDLRIRYANEAAARVLGAPPGTGSSYYHSGDSGPSAPAWLAEMVRASERGGPSRLEHGHREEGEEKVYEVRLQPVVDVSDKFTGTVAILHDITALRLTETALAEKARLLERLSFTDALTGVHNRRGFLVVAEQYLKAARRESSDLFLLFGDLDNLKQINDRFGHPTGDTALVAVAAALQASFRPGDVVARVGGDEFVVLAPGPEPVDLESVLGRFQEQVSRELTQVHPDLEVTISVGWARFDPERHSSLGQFLAEADARMYRDKVEGRETEREAGPVDRH